MSLFTSFILSLFESCQDSAKTFHTCGVALDADACLDLLLKKFQNQAATDEKRFAQTFLLRTSSSMWKVMV